MAADPLAVLNAVQAALHFALAGFLLYVRFGAEANRALALVLVVRGVYIATQAAAGLVADPVLAAYFLRVSAYFVLVIPFTILQLAALYPVRLRWLPSRLPFLPLGIVIGVAWIAHARSAVAVVSVAGFVPGAAASSAVELASGATVASFFLVALLLLREYGRRPDEHAGHSALLVAGGFALSRAYDLVAVALGLRAQAALGIADVVVRVLEPLAFLAFLALLVRQAMRGDLVSSGARRLLVAVAVAIGTGLLDLARTGTVVGDAGLGVLWNLALPVLVAYAILRHQLFGIDLKVRWTIRQSTIGAVFLAVFFVVSEGAQQLFGEANGPYFGVLAAGALVFALAPLQRMAERVAYAALPAADGATTAGAQGERAYRLALRAALRDRVLTREEEQALADLAQVLGLGAGDAMRLRTELEAEMTRRSPTDA